LQDEACSFRVLTRGGKWRKVKGKVNPP